LSTSSTTAPSRGRVRPRAGSAADSTISAHCSRAWRTRSPRGGSCRPPSWPNWTLSRAGCPCAHTSRQSRTADMSSPSTRSGGSGSTGRSACSQARSGRFSAALARRAWNGARTRPAGARSSTRRAVERGGGASWGPAAAERAFVVTANGW